MNAPSFSAPSVTARVRLVLRLAWRGGGYGRAGGGGLWLVLAALTLGVAGIAAILVLRGAIDQGLATRGRELLGGDLSIEGAAPVPPAVAALAARAGGRTAPLVLMRAMLDPPSGARQLVEVKAASTDWPLLGQVAATEASGPQNLSAPGVAALLAPRDGRFGLLAAPLLVAKLGLKPSEALRLGQARFTFRGTLDSEPDAVANPALFGPRVLISTAALRATGLILPGSILHGVLRIVTPPGAGPALAAKIAVAFPDSGLAIRTPADAAPGLSRLIRRVGSFLQLSALTALLVGAIGVVLGVHSFLTARAKGLAVLRCLGAGTGTLFALCLTQVLAIAVVAILLGLAAGLALAVVAAGALGPVLGAGVIVLSPQSVLPALGQAGLYGGLTALAAALWPVGRAARIQGAALFRDASLPAAARPGPGVMLAIGGLSLALGAAIVLGARSPWFALGFLGAALAALAVMSAAGWAVRALAARAPRPRAAFLRLGLAALHRPGGGAAGLTLTALGLGLAALASVALTEANLRHDLAATLSRDAPSFFFIDLQPDQLAHFCAIVAATPGARDLHVVPSLRARVVAVAGVPVDKVKASASSRWALRGDRGLTYAVAPPDGTHLVAGQWWAPDYRGPPLLSLDAGLARGWGVGVGDTVGLNVLGRDITFRIANLRDIAWQRIGLNFAMVASPGLLEGAPHGAIATLIVPPARAPGLLASVGAALPNVTAISVADVLATIDALVGQLGIVLSAAGLLTLAAGAVVLVGALAAERRLRVREAVILKTLGASAATIRAAWGVEFGILGLLAGVLAGLMGTLASALILTQALHTEWHFLPGPMLAMLGLALAAMLGLGHFATAAALRQKAAPWLRNEE